MRRLQFALLSLVLAVAAQPLVAATYYVGSCKNGAFGSISAAVGTVPEGSTSDVCPGTYPEQVTINGAAKGIDTAPAAFTGVNKFYNVRTVRTGGC